MKAHRIQQGEAVYTVAHTAGLPWRKVWADAANSSLSAARDDPNVLNPGDVLHLPELESRDESRGVESKHRFKRPSVRPSLALYVVLRAADGTETVCANEPYRLDLDGHPIVEGTTDGAGQMHERVPPGVEAATLHVPGRSLVMTLLLSHVDPLDTITGIQQRQNQLGFASGPVDGIVGPLTRAGTRAFQQHRGLVVDGIAGPNTQAGLKQAFGS